MSRLKVGDRVCYTKHPEKEDKIKNMFAQYYTELLEQYEDEACAGRFGNDWLISVGESVKFYTLECASDGEIPTFKGLMEYIEKMHKERYE